MAGLTPMFNSRDLNRFYDRFGDDADEKILEVLNYLGESFVSDARESGNYTDRTGNLRSSIGYAVVKDGHILSEDFQASERGSDKSTGVNQARRLVKTLAGEHSTGWVLIGVAGMDYAVSVENINGRDVISSSAKETELLMKYLIKRI